MEAGAQDKLRGYAAERLLVGMLAAICREANIACRPLAGGWILRLERAADVFDIYGFQFPLNSAAACLIAGDKAATAELLAVCGLPAVEHALFRRREHPHDPEPWPALAAYFAAHGGDLVCKPNSGSGGARVARVSELEALRAVSEALFLSERAIALSPWLAIEAEYRLILCRGERLLAYRKLPPPQGWKHNLALGAWAELLAPGPELEALTELARSTMTALGLELAAIDIVAAGGQLRVLEANSGIMLERFARQGEQEYALALGVYRHVVQEMLGD